MANQSGCRMGCPNIEQQGVWMRVGAEKRPKEPINPLKFRLLASPNTGLRRANLAESLGVADPPTRRTQPRSPVSMQSTWEFWL
jgi:hypothetical protein